MELGLSQFGAGEPTTEPALRETLAGGCVVEPGKPLRIVGLPPQVSLRRIPNFVSAILFQRAGIAASRARFEHRRRAALDLDVLFYVIFCPESGLVLRTLSHFQETGGRIRKKLSLMDQNKKRT